MSTKPDSSASSSRPALWKGKGRATNSDFVDLTPPITYRHLLSSSPGVRDPLRVIALCDSDAFYAACEQRRLGIDPELPLVVRQWDALIAVNYPARKFGITRMMKADEALKKCPELKIVHVATFKEGDSEPGYHNDKPDTRTHKVSLDYYRRESTKIIDLFKSGLPTGEIGESSVLGILRASLKAGGTEKASIDEAFIDFSQPVRQKILERYPYLAAVPPDAPDGIDTVLPPPPPISWENRGILIPINPPDEAALGAAQAEAATEGIENVVKDGEDEQTTWHDVALSVAAELMQKIRDDVRIQLGYTTSAGIARNKFLAKLTASYRKRDSQSILRNAAIPNYLKPMPFQKIRFLGGKLGNALAEEYDVSTVSDLLPITLEEMQRKFGDSSIWIYEILRGIDRSEVKEKPAMTKSMLAAKNLGKPIAKASEGPHWLRVLAAELAHRLNEARATSTVWPKTLVLHVRQAPFPFVREVTVDVIAAAGEKLWKELVGGKEHQTIPFKINSISLGFTGFESGESGQQSIHGFFEARNGPVPTSKPSSSSSSVRKRKRNTSASSATSHGLKHVAEAEKIRTPSPTHHPTTASASDLPQGHFGSFMCPRCRKRISLDGNFLAPDAHGDDWVETEMSRLRTEHDDFHLAQDLSRSGDGQMSSGGLRVQDTPRTGKKQRKKKRTAKESPTKESQDIAKFFSRTSS
ncbi:hypothetical protein EWM64_g5277 [Hericium alpestre]|uniref:DNA polymerase eta n=1 Tax=Hericium alpestre TaxID=135208 RepID=A0A4Y9ZX13_9AGAM|nr:hypothetical protein EWM64_g5277 [Hericium alpestre]